MSFKSLGLSSFFIRELANQNFDKPTPIQEKAIPVVLQNKDVLGIAKTGSGKTASYALPILMNLEGKTEEKNRDINVLVLVPTRELAEQVKEVFYQFGTPLPYPAKCSAVYGGVSINPQMKGMYGVNILVATPGRLLELIENKALNLGKISTLVLDESDKMLNLGFKEEMSQIFKLLPKKRQNLLFSATLNEDLDAVQAVLLNNPEIIKIEGEEESIELINQTGYFVDESKKGPLLRYLIKTHEMKQVLVFTSSVYKADNVSDKLRKNGFKAAAIHSKKSQGARTEALRKFKEGNIDILVTTDLLARGIDIKELPFVINYELPRSPKDYIHRIGRTGRAEVNGEAISLISEEEKHHFRVIQKKMKKWVTMVDSENMKFS